MGELFAKHFVAAHQQVGDFTAVEVDGTIQKNGGNVASYFCTPEGRVIHAVTGPVSADELLAAAQWAIDRWDEVKDLSTLAVQRAAMAAAHDKAIRDNAAATSGKASPGLRGLERYSQLWAEVAQHIGSQADKVHLLLREMPLAALDDVYVHVFERILGERVSKETDNDRQAVRGLQYAAQHGRPILFVLLRGRMEHNYAQQQWLAHLETMCKSDRHLGSILRACTVIVVPLKELPALSQKTKQPPYSALTQGPSGSFDLVVADARGKQRPKEPDIRMSDPKWLSKYLAIAVAQELKLAPTEHRKTLRQTIQIIRRIDFALAKELEPLIEEVTTKQPASPRNVKQPAVLVVAEDDAE